MRVYSQHSFSMLFCFYLNFFLLHSYDRMEFLSVIIEAVVDI